LEGTKGWSALRDSRKEQSRQYRSIG
jgi:hypothetical protein